METITQTKIQGCDAYLSLHRANRRSHQTRPNRRRDDIMIASASYTGSIAAVLPQIAHPASAAQQLLAPARQAQRREGRNPRSGRPRPHPINENAGARTYDAFDSKLQLWVAATIYAKLIGNYEAVYGPLEPGVAERAYQQFRIIGTVLQVPLAMWPANIGVDRTIQNENSVLLK